MITYLHQESHWRLSLLKLALARNLVLLHHCINLAKIVDPVVDQNCERSPFKCFHKFEGSVEVLLQHLGVR